MCDTPGEVRDESIDIGGCSALPWQVGDLIVICDSGASCHMSHSSAGMLNYRESNANIVRRAVRDTRSRVTAIYRLPFDLVQAMYLCC